MPNGLINRSRMPSATSSSGCCWPSPLSPSRCSAGRRRRPTGWRRRSPSASVGADGAVLMSNADIVAGKAGFQRADLMDYGSLYGMGSYFGEDYTASTLVRLGTAARGNVAQAANGNLRQPHAGRAGRRHHGHAARPAGHRSDQGRGVVPPSVAAAVVSVRDEIAKALNVADPATGWTQAYSLSPQHARQTADFLMFSSLTTVARRPGVTFLDPELAFRAAGRQHADDQHLPLDVDQLLFHLLRLRRWCCSSTSAT